MKLVFKGIPFQLIYTPLVTIITSAILTGIALFFTNIIGGNQYQFVSFWKAVYIWMVIFGFATDVVLKVLYRIFFGLYHAKKFQVSFNDILDARMTYDIFKNQKFSAWTPEDFKIKYQSAKGARVMADVVREIFKGR